MNSRIIAVIVILVTNFRMCQGFKRYDSYSLYSVIPVEIDHLKFLQNLEKHKYIDVIFWREPFKLYEEVQFLVSPNDTELFQERIKHFGLNAKLKHVNIQDAFDAQNVGHYFRSQSESYSWSSYHSLENIYQWLQDISSKNPKNIKLEIIGKSDQERDIIAVGILNNPQSKIKVIVEAGMHGNEWVATEFVTFLISQLMNASASQDNRLKDVARNYQWWLVPVANPDGYEYSHTTDRLWRKNRRYFEDSNSFGVDLNRNFDYSFGSFDTSKDPKHENYCGPSPLSEPETTAFTKFVLKKSNDLNYFFSIHSFGQKLIIPFSDRVVHMGNYAEMENYGKQAILKMYKLSGVKYSVGTVYDTLGKKVSGNSASWVKKAYDVRYVFTFLLRDDGSFGHALPPDQILPTCEEAMTGLLEIMTTSPRRVRANMFSNSDRPRFGSAVLSFIVFWLVK